MKRVDFDYLEQKFPARPGDAHKGTMGTLCSITGSSGFSGAAVLSAQAALRTGVGLLYQLLPDSIYPIFASSVFESVCVPLQSAPEGHLSAQSIPQIRDALEKATAVLIGCGMQVNNDTTAVLANVVRDSMVPLIIDADGINVIAQHTHILGSCRVPIILTPHVKEFSRLSGWDVADILEDPALAATDFAHRNPDITLVLKGHRTYIARNDEIYENIAGNSGMAKGGSGDVLAGIIASLTAQGAEPFEAAVMGVHIHALAGDIAAAQYSRTAMLPGDIIRALPEIFSKIEDSRDNGQ